VIARTTVGGVNAVFLGGDSSMSGCAHGVRLAGATLAFESELGLPPAPSTRELPVG
jgi:hypothetical protein